jgi:hypothetical protein
VQTLEELIANLKTSGGGEGLTTAAEEAMSQLRNSLKDKADVAMLDSMKGDLMIQLYDIVEKQVGSGLASLQVHCANTV